MVRSDYTFSNSAEEILRMVRRDPAYASILREAEDNTRFAVEHFHDDVSRIAGWGHNFVCPDCASQLIFDPAMAYPPEKPFVCPHCGKEAVGKDLDEAWVYYYRYRFGSTLSDAALCALLGDEKALDFLISYIDFYAAHYEEFPVHGDHAGKGKIMGQSLDEAVWGIQLLYAMKIVEELLPDEKKAGWLEKLFRPMCALLAPQSNRIHNIPTWQRAFIGIVGLYFDDDALLHDAMDGDFGLRRQIACGFTKDGMWRECSLGYHYYTVEALTDFFSFYALKAPNDPLFDIFEKMYTAPLALSYDGFTLPALNDGWYPQSVSALVLRAARLSSDPAIADQVASLRRRVPERLLTLSALLYAFPEKTLTLYQDTNLAIFRAPVFAILKSGVLEASHMHHDYLSISLPPFSDDLGTPGYGHALTPAWYRLGASHDLVTVDQEVTGDVIPSRIEAIPGGARAVIESGAWKGLTHAERSLTEEDGALADRSFYESEEEHTFDWIFHSLGEASFSSALTPCAPLGEENGYRFFTNVRKAASSPSFKAEFALNGKMLSLEIPDADGLEIYVANSPANPADILRHTVILRKRGKSARFFAKFRVL